MKSDTKSLKSLKSREQYQLIIDRCEALLDCKFLSLIEKLKPDVFSTAKEVQSNLENLDELPDPNLNAIIDIETYKYYYPEIWKTQHHSSLSVLEDQINFIVAAFASPIISIVKRDQLDVLTWMLENTPESFRGRSLEISFSKEEKIPASLFETIFKYIKHLSLKEIISEELVRNIVAGYEQAGDNNCLKEISLKNIKCSTLRPIIKLLNLLPATPKPSIMQGVTGFVASTQNNNISYTDITIDIIQVVPNESRLFKTFVKPETALSLALSNHAFHNKFELDHKKIVNFTLKNTMIHKSMLAPLQKLLSNQQGLKKINLSGLDFPENETKKLLLEEILKNTELEELTLKQCYLGDNDLQLLIIYLKNSNNLRILDLTGNNFSEESLKRLGYAISNTNLTITEVKIEKPSHTLDIALLRNKTIEDLRQERITLETELSKIAEPSFLECDSLSTVLNKLKYLLKCCESTKRLISKIYPNLEEATAFHEKFAEKVVNLEWILFKLITEKKVPLEREQYNEIIDCSRIRFLIKEQSSQLPRKLFATALQSCLATLVFSRKFDEAIAVLEEQSFIVYFGDRKLFMGIKLYLSLVKESMHLENYAEAFKYMKEAERYLKRTEQYIKELEEAYTIDEVIKILKNKKEKLLPSFNDQKFDLYKHHISYWQKRINEDSDNLNAAITATIIGVEAKKLNIPAANELLNQGHEALVKIYCANEQFAKALEEIENAKKNGASNTKELENFCALTQIKYLLSAVQLLLYKSGATAKVYNTIRKAHEIFGLFPDELKFSSLKSLYFDLLKVEVKYLLIKFELTDYKIFEKNIDLFENIESLDEFIQTLIENNNKIFFGNPALVNELKQFRERAVMLFLSQQSETVEIVVEEKSDKKIIDKETESKGAEISSFPPTQSAPPIKTQYQTEYEEMIAKLEKHYNCSTSEATAKLPTIKEIYQDRLLGQIMTVPMVVFSDTKAKVPAAYTYDEITIDNLKKEKDGVQLDPITRNPIKQKVINLQVQEGIDEFMEKVRKKYKNLMAISVAETATCESPILPVIQSKSDEEESFQQPFFSGYSLSDNNNQQPLNKSAEVPRNFNTPYNMFPKLEQTAQENVLNLPSVSQDDPWLSLAPQVPSAPPLEEFPEPSAPPLEEDSGIENKIKVSGL